ncbi:mCG1051098 [Mus musculus]|nr:mCG1051098 [Mus musculus]
MSTQTNPKAALRGPQRFSAQDKRGCFAGVCLSAAERGSPLELSSLTTLQCHLPVPPSC